MMAMDFANGCLSLVMVALLVTQTMQLWMLLVLMLLYSLAGAFHNAAFDTSYAMLVSEEQLPRANGMMQTILVALRHPFADDCGYSHFCAGPRAAGVGAGRSRRGVGPPYRRRGAGDHGGRDHLFHRSRHAGLFVHSIAQAQ